MPYHFLKIIDSTIINNHRNIVWDVDGGCNKFLPENKKKLKSLRSISIDERQFLYTQ